MELAQLFLRRQGAVTHPGCFGDRYTGLGAQKTLFKFSFFQLCVIKKYVDVAINDFTKYLIISKWLRRQKNADKREKQTEKNHLSERRNYLRKCFHSFKYIIDHANVRFILYEAAPIH